MEQTSDHSQASDRMNKDSDFYAAIGSLGMFEVASGGAFAAGTVYGGSRASQCIVLNFKQKQTCVEAMPSQVDSIALGWSPSGNTLLVGEDPVRDERLILRKILIPSLEVNSTCALSDGAFISSAALEGGEGAGILLLSDWDPLVKGASAGFRLLRYNPENAGLTVLAELGEAYEFVPRVDYDGKWVLVVKFHAEDSSSALFVVDLVSLQETCLVQFLSDQEVQGFFLGRSHKIFVVTKHKGVVKAEIIDLQSRTRITLKSPETFLPDDIFVPPGSEMAVVSRFENGRLSSGILDCRRDSLLLLSYQRDELLPLGPIEGGLWLGRVSSSGAVSSLVTFAPNNGEPKPLEVVYSPLVECSDSANRFVAAQDVCFNADDGLAVHALLFSPHTPNGRALLYVHGGPSSHVRNVLNPEIQFFVNAGFVVLAVNYRGSTGYGYDFENKLKEKGCGSGEVLDLRAGAEWLLSNQLAKPGNIAMVGASYGAYLGWCCLVRLPTELLGAVIVINGMVDLEVDYWSTRPEIQSFSRKLMRGSPETKAKDYKRASPFFCLNDVKAPVLVVHGLRDTNVNCKQVLLAIEQLKEKGKKFDTLFFPDEGHAILSPNNRSTMLNAIRVFLLKNL